MKIKVPKEIQIGCHSYKVFLKDKTIPSEDASIEYPLEEIRVKANIPERRKAVVFIHEAVHFINVVFSLGFHDEETVERLAEGLGQLLFANMGIELDWSGIPTKTATIKEEK